MKNFGRKALSLVLVFAMILSLGVTAFAADDDEYFNHTLKITTNNNANWQQADGVTDGSAWNCAKGRGFRYLYLESLSSKTMLLSFHYHVVSGTGYYKLGSNAQIDWSASEENDVIDLEVQQGEKVTITAKNNAVIEISNITFVEKPSDTNVTFVPADHGTVTVGGVNIAQEETLPPDNEKLYSLSAEPEEGYLFAFWYDLTDAAVLSNDAYTSLELENEHTVTAVFTEDVAEAETFFTVNDFPFASYEDALAFAESYGLDTIVLVQDFTIEQDIEVPAGITLLVPYNNLHTCFKDNIWAFDVNNTTRVDPRVNQNYSTPYAFKTLTIASGVTVTVNGELSVSAQHTAPSGTDPKGGPTGPCGFMNLQAGSEVVVNGGFYAFGYVVGEGHVTVNSGAQVFEVMQIADFRGGSASLGAYGNGVFPFSQYYVQNVEAPMTLNAGATEYVVASLSVTFQSVKVLPSVKVEFIGENGMFRMTDGSLTKTYLGDSDRLQIDVDGDGAIKSMQLSLAGMPIDSATVPLPINNNITINVLSGETEMGQSIALLPGAKISVAEGAKVVLTENTGTYVTVVDDEEVTLPLSNAIFVYDRETWMGGNYILKNRHFAPIAYAPGMEYTRTDADLVDAEIDVNGTIEIADGFYTTTGGSQIISSNGTGSIRYLTDVLTGDDLPTSTPQYKNSEEAVQLPIVPAQLTNLDTADEPYTSTASAVAGDAFYWINDLGKWFKGFVITFDANGGEGTMDPMYVSSDNPEVPLPANTFTKPGFKFYGWSATTSMDDTLYEDGDTFYGNEYGEYCDTTLYAVWEESSEVTVTFDANAVDAEGTMEPLSVDPEETFQLPACGYSREDYDFVGWATEPDATEAELFEGDEFGTSEDVTLYAVWKANYVTVIFHSDFGEPEETATQKIRIAELETKPLAANSFTREGYTFQGWSFEPDGSVEIQDKAPLGFEAEGVIDLYAVWKGHVTITFMPCGAPGDPYTQSIPYDVQTKLTANRFVREGYEFAGWAAEEGGQKVVGDCGNFTTDEDQVLYALWAPNTYTVTFVNEDGTELSQFTIEYGVAPEYNGAEPTKDATAQYTYAFSGWKDENGTFYAKNAALPAATGDATYTAQFTESVNTYTVTWKNYDGTVLETDENVPYGTIPNFDGEAPVREPDAANVYAFDKWDNDPAAVTGNITYTALFTASPRLYAVRFLNEDGTELQSSEVAYGETPEYTGETPTKAPTDTQRFEFAGWNPAVVPVDGAIDYYATFSAVPITYAIVFKANGGEGEDVTVVAAANEAIKLKNEEDFSRTGYDLVAWTTNADGTGDRYTNFGTGVIFTADTTLYAQWQKQTYTITWKNDDGTVLAEDTFAYGETPEYTGDTPTRGAADGEEGVYTFAGWTPEIVSVNGDAVYTAQFTFTGWRSDENGKQYFVNDEMQTGWLELDGSKYYLDPTTGYAAVGVVQIGEDDPGHAFDANGVWQESVSGVFTDSKTEDVYLIAKGIVEVFPGLYMTGNHEYYYFGEDNKAVRGTDAWCEKNHADPNDVKDRGMLPKWGYVFGTDGIIEHEDVNLNGVVETEPGVWYYYIDGIRVHYGLFEKDGGYYYANSKGRLITGRAYWCTDNYGILPEGSYTFDETGRMIEAAPNKNGIVDEDGSKWYYVDGVRTYAGLIKIDGSYYYVKTSGEVVHGQKYWITKTNNLLPEKAYEFDESGKLIVPPAPKNGIVDEDGSKWYYVDGVRTYAGVFEYNGAYYYAKSNGEVVHGRSYWISKTNGIVPEKSYVFEEDGRMVLDVPVGGEGKNGIVDENGSKWYYVDGQLTYAGLIQIDGDYYYVKTNGEVVHGRTYWITKTNGLLQEKAYTFDDSGRIVNP